MTWELDPIPSTEPIEGSYLTLAEADELAATLPGLDRYKAAGDETRSALLLLASIDIDAAGPWQGRKYDLDGSLTGTPQRLEFPRLSQDVGRVFMPSAYRPDTLTRIVWEWDLDAGAAVVPRLVKIAVLYQAESLCDQERQAFLQRIADGLASKSVGPLSESYRADAVTSGGGMRRLAERARSIMDRYRLRSGKLL